MAVQDSIQCWICSWRRVFTGVRLAGLEMGVIIAQFGISEEKSPEERWLTRGGGWCCGESVPSQYPKAIRFLEETVQ